MHPQEIAGVIVVVVANVIPPVLVVGEARAWFRHGRPFGRFFYAAVALLVLQLACAGWALFVEPDWVATTRHTLSFAHLPTGSRARILHLSDLHAEDTPGCRTRLAAARREAQAEKPDLICLTGDYAIERAGIPLAASFVAGLAEIAPTVCIRGNWDRSFIDASEDIRKTPALWLEREARTIPVGSLSIGLCGFMSWDLGALPGLLPAVASADLRLVLTHTPDRMPEAATLGADLYLCGHTHGGQVRIPWYGAVITLTDTGKRFEAGLYNVQKMIGYTSRGLGMEGGSLPRIRFLCRPEVAVFDIRGP